MFGFFARAAADLQPGESTTVTNSKGDSYTVEVKLDGTRNVRGNNQQSKDKLNAEYDEDE